MYEPGENYLEAILISKEQQRTVRSTDIARTLNFSKPSVSRAASTLKEDGYITMEVGGDIKLTEKGRGKAAAIHERRKLLTSFFQKAVGVPEEVAEDDVCRMEHIISGEVFQGTKRFMNES